MLKANSPQVVCMGVITMDTIALVERYPDADERVLAREIVRAGGGPAAVAAVALARFGISTAIVGTIGDDEDGHEVLRIFERESIDAQGISFASAHTAGSVIVAALEGSTRAISTRQPLHQAPINDHAKSIAQKADWIHTDHVGIHMLGELEVSKGMGPLISFDAGYGVENFDPSLVDLFVPTDRQMKLRYPQLELAQSLQQDSQASECTVVATCGGEGSAGFSSTEGYVHAKGFSVDVVSTLGAGDVFHGALIAQLVQGRTLESSLRRANAVAALSCRAIDGQSGIPNTQELEKFLERQL